MNLNKLKSFAIESRRKLMRFVADKMAFVLAPESAARRSSPESVRQLEEAIARQGKEQVVEATAYMWFNRFCALRFMDANHYTSIGVVTPAEGATRPEILSEAAGTPDVVAFNQSMSYLQIIIDISFFIALLRQLAFHDQIIDVHLVEWHQTAGTITQFHGKTQTVFDTEQLHNTIIIHALFKQLGCHNQFVMFFFNYHVQVFLS